MIKPNLDALIIGNTRGVGGKDFLTLAQRLLKIPMFYTWNSVITKLTTTLARRCPPTYGGVLHSCRGVAAVLRKNPDSCIHYRRRKPAPEMVVNSSASAV